MNWKKQRSNLSDTDPSNIGTSINRQSSRDILNIYNWVWLWVWLGHAVVFLTDLPHLWSQGARIREVRMDYEFISLGCGKCNTTPLLCFPTKHNYVYRLLIIYYTIASKLPRYRGGSGIKKMVRPGSGCGHLVMCEPAVNGC